MVVVGFQRHPEVPRFYQRDEGSLLRTLPPLWLIADGYLPDAILIVGGVPRAP